MPITDFAYLLRDGTVDLVGVELAGATVNVGHGPRHGMKLGLFVPAAPGGVGFTFQIEQAAIGGAWGNVEAPVATAIVAAGYYEYKLDWHHPLIRWTCTIHGGANNGGVVAGLTLGDMVTS